MEIEQLKRRCVDCSTLKPVSDFQKSKRGYYDSYCKPCKSVRRKAYYIKNRERSRESARLWAKNNEDHRKETYLRYWATHREELIKKGKVRRITRGAMYLETQRKKREQNPEPLRKYAREYGLTHRAEIRERHRVYQNERYAKEPAYRLMVRARERHRSTIRRSGVHTERSTLELLGCTREQYKSHIGSLFHSGMTWDNSGQGPGKWEIDHVIAVGLFDLRDPEQLKQCFHYTNLRPLWHEDHKTKTINDNRKIRAKKHADKIKSFPPETQESAAG